MYTAHLTSMFAFKSIGSKVFMGLSGSNVMSCKMYHFKACHMPNNMCNETYAYSFCMVIHMRKYSKNSLQLVVLNES